MADDDRETSCLRRRSLVIGAAWATPVIVAVAPAPAFAASTCVAPTVPFPTGWTATSPNTGTLSPGGPNGVVNFDGTPRYLSVQDNASTTQEATVLYQRSISLQLGNRYRFSFSVASNFGSNNSAVSTAQRLAILLDGSARFAAATKPAAGFQTLNTTNGVVTVQDFSFDYVATSTGSFAYQIVFALAVKTAAGSGGGDDIAVSAPTITCF